MKPWREAPARGNSGTLQNIFEAASQTFFRWESWKRRGRHRSAIYAYKVDSAHSRYLVANGSPSDLRKAVVSFHGIVEVDRETGEVLHFSYVADEIPKAVDLKRVSTTVDYDFADVGGRNYLLPAHSETEIYGASLSVRNDIEFREYRKFSADSTIEFGIGK